jgi:hypothetical protein
MIKYFNYPKIIFLFAFLGILFLTGCSGYLPVPGGNETTNQEFYETDDDLFLALNKLQPGMSEAQVFTVLDRKKEDFIKLDRYEILDVLYGGSDTELQQGVSEQNQQNHLLQSLYGYRFSFKKIETEHGLSSPIRMKTDEDGYNYTVSLIFRNGYYEEGFLFEKPVIAGGKVHNSYSSTIFDYLNPGIVLDRY